MIPFCAVICVVTMTTTTSATAMGPVNPDTPYCRTPQGMIMTVPKDAYISQDGTCNKGEGQ